jgi:hypothetical protein
VPTLIHCAFVVESTKKQREKQETKKEYEKNEERKKKKKKDNLILSHVNINFLLIRPYAFTHIHCSLKKMFFNVKKHPI